MSGMIVFTDLDGTLLDHDSYGVRGALPAIDLLIRRRFPVIPVTSKTASEVRRWIKLLTLEGPFIYENGCGIVVPVNSLNRKPAQAVEVDNEWRISLGEPFEDVRRALEVLSVDAGFKFRSLDQMTNDELSSLTGLAGEELKQCLAREFDVPFVITGDYDEEAIAARAAEKGYHFTRGGRFHHLTGGCDKGKAVRILAEHYREEKSKPLLVAIGDSFNDLPMFLEVDMAFLVQKTDGTYDHRVPEDTVRRVRGIGPAGWRAAIEEVMSIV